MYEGVAGGRAPIESGGRGYGEATGGVREQEMPPASAKSGWT